MPDYTRRSFLKILGGAGVSATAFGLFGCSSNGDAGDSTGAAGTELNLNDWDAILEAAKGTTVTYIGYSQISAYSMYFNNVFAPEIKDKYDLSLNYTPVDATADINTLWMGEKQAGYKQGDGSTDLAWTSTGNFADLKKNDLLWGDFVQYLPNMQYYDKSATGINYDASVAIDGTESLFGSSFFALIYDSTTCAEADAPRNATELLAYAKDNPGRVTYSALPDYQGSYMVRTLVMDICGKDVFQKMPEGITYDEMKEQIAEGLNYLRELNPYLWNEGKTYPAAYSDWAKMFADAETDFVFDQAWVQASIDAGMFPKTAHSVLVDYSISLPHYLALSFDCPNIAGALVMANEFLDPIGMCERSVMGYPPAVDCMDMEKLTAEQLDAIEECERLYGQNSPTLAELGEHAVPDIPGWCETVLEDIWLNEVAAKTN
ncbi:MAG: ABC transporter substrate-binding protein [Coriobacteriales bacterium]|nr:ABC transporter substrate-binding protein [Coriobacteriales bacterium]